VAFEGGGVVGVAADGLAVGSVAVAVGWSCGVVGAAEAYGGGVVEVPGFVGVDGLAASAAGEGELGGPPFAEASPLGGEGVGAGLAGGHGVSGVCGGGW